MKIAIYQPRVSYYVGGGEVVPLEHAKYLSKSGHRVTLVTTRASFIKKSEYFIAFLKNNPKVKVAYLDLPKELSWIYQEKPGQRWIRWDYESLYVGRIAFNYFSKNNFDLVGVHNFLDVLAIPSKQKSVLHLHGYPAQANYMHELCLVIPDRFIAVSSFIRKKWKQLLPLKEVFVATHGIDGSKFKPLSKTKKQFDVLYIGRLIPIKGVSYLIKAISLLKNNDLKVAIVGSGPELSVLKSLVKKNKLERQVNFLGYIKDRDLPKLYNSAKVVALPSYDREGILTTMLEASACGVPVITTSACSMSEFLRPRKNGLLVKPQSVKDLAQAINLLLTNEVLRKKLGRQARRDVETRWDWKIKIKTVEKLYEQA